MNRFSDAGSTPAVSSPEGRAAKLGLFEVEKCGDPTTVEFVRCVGMLHARKAGRPNSAFLKLKNAEIPRPWRMSVRKHRLTVFFLFQPVPDVPENRIYLPHFSKEFFKQEKGAFFCYMGLLFRP